jgi:zinc transport system ATP-binding protein
MAPVIQADNISLVIGGLAILESVSLSVEPAESVTIVGPNGAGKSLLLRVLLGLMPATTGTVTRQPGLRIGYLPQTLFPDPILPMNVSRFISIGSRTGSAQSLKMLEEVGIEHLVDRPIHDLSGGELRRAMLARALLREPEILVLDEPVQGVDLTGQVELYERISRARSSRGCAVLMVSHDLHLVMASTDRVICLNRHICCQGAPESVRGHAEYQALFGPEVSSLAVYTHHHDHAHGAEGEVVPLDQAQP